MNSTNGREVLGIPYADKYRVSYVRAHSYEDECPLLRNETLNLNGMIEFLDKKIAPNTFICEITDWKENGQLSFLDKKNVLHSRVSKSVPFRESGLYFLKQFFEDATKLSIHATGIFEVYPLPTNDDQNDIITGAISHYFSRANSITKEICKMDLREVGIIKQFRRNGFDDQFGNPLPRYTYRLNINLCLINQLYD